VRRPTLSRASRRTHHEQTETPTSHSIFSLLAAAHQFVEIGNVKPNSATASGMKRRQLASRDGSAQCHRGQSRVSGS
jgi:hypothetical protein